MCVCVCCQVGTPYLETYLQRRASQSDDKVAALDMLWKHYEKNNNFTAAARILSQLSQRHGSVNMLLIMRVITTVTCALA